MTALICGIKQKDSMRIIPKVNGDNRQENCSILGSLPQSMGEVQLRQKRIFVGLSA